MIVSKSVGIWGEGADEAKFVIDVVGNTPDEVKHLQTLVEEPLEVAVTFSEGALHLVATFKRKVSLADQQAQEAADAAKVAADNKAAADKLAADEQAKSDAAAEAIRAGIIERSAQIVADSIKAAK